MTGPVKDDKRVGSELKRLTATAMMIQKRRGEAS